MSRETGTVRSLATNRRARHDYEVLEDHECGLVLRGTEVKSLRQGRCSIGEAFGRFDAGELWLFGATIPEYSHGNIHNHAPDRPRKLLLSRRELAKWSRAVREKGVTIVPLDLYFRGHLVKARMALVRGKKLHDKREDKKRKDAEREIGRALRRR